jgi:hypothetical protein
MSESNIKIFLEELTYVASIPYNEAITTYSYYNNLSKELEFKKCLNLSLKIELDEKKEIIKELKSDLEQKEDIIYLKDEKLKELKSNLNDLNKCSVCFENKLSVCLNPCGHCYCDICIKNATNCFICRTNIINKIKLFL